MAIEGKKALLAPPISLVPVKNLFAKTTSIPFAEFVELIGVDFVLPVPDSMYLFSTLDGKEASNPNSVNFMFSFASTDVSSLLNLKNCPTNEPFVKLTKLE